MGEEGKEGRGGVWGFHGACSRVSSVGEAPVVANDEGRRPVAMACNAHEAAMSEIDGYRARKEEELKAVLSAEEGEAGLASGDGIRW